MKAAETLITPKETAAQLRISVRCLQMWTAAKKIECVKLSPHCVRYTQSAIAAVIKRHTARAV